MIGSIIVRTSSVSGAEDRYYLTIAGAFRRAFLDCEALHCEPPVYQAFVEVIEESRVFRVVHESSVIEFRARPLGD